ncbi:MAG: universal stress protein [Chloroflexota bacterium]|nr:MAG: universal stress protein [Chloroflexota bacterium]
MLNHILVPLDGSKLSETALDHAKNLVAAGGKITLLRVVEAGVLVSRLQQRTDDPDKVDKHARRVAREYLSGFAAEFSKEGKQAEIEVREGKPAEAIVKAAQELGVDAIVISTHGRTGISRLVVGSVTQDVINTATCLIIVVPNMKN